MLDLNDAGPQLPPLGELIPDGTFCKLKLSIRRGGDANGPGPGDQGLLKRSHKGDVLMLDCEFVVLEGAFARRKFWQNFTVSGGKQDKNGNSIAWNMTKATLRAMVESAFAINPKDESPEAKQRRQLPALSVLDGLEFIGRVMVEPATSDQYSDSNRLANVVLPGDAQYEPVRNGQEVEPDPVNAKPRKTKQQDDQAAGWQTGGQQGGGQQGSLDQGGGWGQQAGQQQSGGWGQQQGGGKQQGGGSEPAWLSS